MEEKKISPLKAIRLKCLDCSGDSHKEVENCWAKNCPLYLYRSGKRGTKKNLTDEQRQAISERMKRMHKKKEDKNELCNRQ